MAKKLYTYTYGPMEAECKIEIDLDVFTADHANSVLDFFTWYYDKEADPIDEFMKKLALMIFQIGSESELNESGVMRAFESEEGWPRIDGSIGLKLIYIDNFRFDEDMLNVEISER